MTKREVETGLVAVVLGLGLGLGLGLAACNGGGGSGDGTGDGDGDGDGDGGGAVTYYQTVKPIFDAKCVNCHVAGGIAPFVLDNYADALERHAAIRDAVTTGLMPPWLAADGCTEYVGDRSLTAAQIELLSMWSAAGAPEGDAAHPAAPLPDTEVGLTRVDATLAMASAYTATTTPDDYRCFVLDWPETTTKYITGFKAVPGNAQVVHHVIAYYVPPNLVDMVMQKDAAEAGQGYTCFGGPGFSNGEWLGSWAPGSRGSDFPPGTGLEIVAGSKVVLQVHYNDATAGVQPDLTQVELKLDDSVTKVARIQPFTNPQWLNGNGMIIPAGAPETMHSFSADLTFLFGSQPIDIWSVGFHQHQLGTGGKVEIRRGDGSTECMVDIPRWDFHWQGAYGFPTPKRFNPGDDIYLECHWDNSTGDSMVKWGEGTGDEMCLTGFYVTPAD